MEVTLDFEGRSMEVNKSRGKVVLVLETIKVRARLEGDFFGKANLDVSECEVAIVGLNLVFDAVKSLNFTSINNLLNEESNILSIFVKAKDEISFERCLLVRGKGNIEFVWNLVKVSKFTKGAKELIG